MKILVCGISGRMGKEVAKLAESGYRGAELIGGYDIVTSDMGDVPVYTDYADIAETPDVIVDFSHHAAIASLLDYAENKNVPVVIATTGHTDDELALINESAKKLPIFHSANMSLGIALLVELAKISAATFPDADIEIIEKHHNRKLDAPSGTALLLANAIKSVRENAFFTFGRHGNAKRTNDEIGIHALRMGNLVGEHEVIIATDTQTVTLKHEAHSRSLFAEGALAAAEYMIGKKAGMYDMNTMITEK